MQPATEQPTVCPRCGAAVQTDVPWCTLCYAALHPEPERAPTGTEEASTPSQAGTPSRAGTPSDVNLLAERMLAELAATRDPAPAWVNRLPTTPGTRAGLIVGTVVVASLALVALMTLVGLLL